MTGFNNLLYFSFILHASFAVLCESALLLLLLRLCKFLAL